MAAQADILVANEPAAYREMLASELPLLRPGLRVLQADPADLDAVVARLRPRLVICNRLTEIVRRCAAASIVLYPDGTNQAAMAIAAEQWLVPNPQLTDILAAVDTVMHWVSSEPGQPPSTCD